MGSFLDFYDAADGSSDRAPLTERRLGEEPSLVILFSTASEVTRLHYEDASEYSTYVVCPGDRCPLCHLGKAAQSYLLLPVYDLEDAKVKVLRVSTRKSVGALAPQLVPLLRKQTTRPEITQISRKRGTYTVKSSPLQETADDGREAIAAFLKECEHGLKLVSAFPSPTAEELASTERTRRKLEALGNYFTDASRRPAGDVSDPDAEGD